MLELLKAQLKSPPLIYSALFRDNSHPMNVLITIHTQMTHKPRFLISGPVWDQSCPTMCDPIDGSPLGSPIPGIVQARTLNMSKIKLMIFHTFSLCT